MSILSRLRCITVDVTGTLIAYKGELGDYYCMTAKSVGSPCPDYTRMHQGFKIAYTHMANKYPCFGHAAKMPNIIWWKTCERDSFVKAGYDYDEETFEKVFRRIYSTFEKVFRRTYLSRYQDAILPSLGLNKGTEWDFGVFSGLEGAEKPDPRIYEIALERAGNIPPGEVLHIGDSMLLDRFKTPDAKSWRDSGAP